MADFPEANFQRIPRFTDSGGFGKLLVVKFMRHISTFLRRGIPVALGGASLAAFAAEAYEAAVRASNLASGETCGPIAFRLGAPMDSLRFFDFAPTATSLLFGIGWPPESVFPGNRLDLFHFHELALSNAAHFASAQVEPSWSNVVAEVPWQGVADLAFFRVADATDSDGDGLTDYEERWQYGADPNNPDTDGDGFSDGEEVGQDTSPLKLDTDGDGLSDLEEMGRVRKLKGCAFEEGGLLTNLTSAVRTSLDGGGSCVEWAFPAPVVVRERTYDRIAIDPNGIVYLRQPGMADAIPRFACPDDFQQVLGQLEECVLMPYWAPLALSDTNPASAITVSDCADGYLVEFANMRFDAAAAAAAIGEDSSLAAFLPLFLDRGWRVSFQVHIPSEGNEVSFAYETVEPTVLHNANVNSGGVATDGIDDWLPSIVNGALSAGGIQLPNLGFTKILWSSSPDAVATGEKYVLTLGTGTDPTQAESEATDDEVMVRFVMGDPSWTLSERYRMEVKPVSGPRGVTSMPSTHEHVNGDRGVMEPFDVPLRKGWHYEVRLYHHDSSLGKGKNDYDYDYVFGCVPSSPRVIKEDPDGLFAANIRWRKTHDFGAEGLVAHLCVLGDPLLVPDYDRNRDIDDDDVEKAKNGEAFRFWVNDDNDSGDTNDSDNDRPGSGENHGNGKIDGHCDILDFTPIWIDLSPVFPQDYIERFWGFMDWKLQSSCVNVVWSGLRRDEAGDFHIDDTRFIYADDLMTGLLSNGTVCACSALPLSHAVKAWILNDANRGIFLIEGCKVGAGLSIVGKLQGTDAVVSNLLDLRVSSVEDMYEFISIRDAAENREFLPSIKTNQLEEAVGLDVFFIHGFNVDEPGARAWGAEVFKRLWQSGSNARFHMVTWRGDYNWTGISLFNALHYQHDAYFAQMTAKAFKYAVEKVQGDSRKRIVMGHSLGNMVVCEALRENLYTAKYFMFNAAVPSEAVDAEKQAKDGSNPAFYRYVPRGWRNYHFLSWASNWWRWFAEDDLDSRVKIGWPGRYEFAISNSGQPYNYYSKGDDIFLEASNPPWFAKGMLTSSSLYSWQKQETLKGTGQLGGTLFGGWSFHLWEERELVIEPGNNNYFKDVTCWYSVSDVNEMIANGTIVDTPVFNRDASEMFDHNASVDDQFLCLAKCVPAISTAIGGCAALEEENTDLNTMKYRNGWGRDAESGGSMPWKHSDLKDMAYFYVYKLYDEIVKEKGRLK